MKKIGILSDTHGYIHPRVLDFFSGCDEIWHAGDIGSEEVISKLSDLKPLRAVYGNIDGNELRMRFQETESFRIEDAQVLITHIGGYPGRYAPKAAAAIKREHPGLFVCGHSHILKVMYDEKFKLLCINPGAAGRYGLHKSVTAVRFVIDGNNFRDLEVIDLPR